MLDIKFIVENLNAVRQNCQNRGVFFDADAFVRLREERRRLEQTLQDVYRRQKLNAESYGELLDDDYRQSLIIEGRTLRQLDHSLSDKLANIDEELCGLATAVPNMSHPDAPVGRSASDSRIVRSWGSRRVFNFPVKDHVEIAERLGLVDFAAGASTTGAKFYFLKGNGAMLELALVNYAMSKLRKCGYVPVITPDLAKQEVLAGVGFMPKGPESQIYRIEDSDLCLIATSEITLGGMHRNKTLAVSPVPLRYAGLSHCFRTEAGSAGRDAKGLYRVHQFTKVEMFVICEPDRSDSLHREILDVEESIFQDLGLHYRVVDTCTGELGGPAYRKFDIEAWMPGRGEFGEVTSTSNCTDFQSRRLGIRFRDECSKAHFVHTLNGTAIAVSRAMVAILENYQQADGSVRVPDVLRPWLPDPCL